MCHIASPLPHTTDPYDPLRPVNHTLRDRPCLRVPSLTDPSQAHQVAPTLARSGFWNRPVDPLPFGKEFRVRQSVRCSAQKREHTPLCRRDRTESQGRSLRRVGVRASDLGGSREHGERGLQERKLLLHAPAHARYFIPRIFADSRHAQQSHPRGIIRVSPMLDPFLNRRTHTVRRMRLVPHTPVLLTRQTPHPHRTRLIDARVRTTIFDPHHFL